MTQLHKDPNALRGTHQPGILERLNKMNTKLEEIQKSLDMYLEVKRQLFPRFYFLSNDDLLEILGQSRNPEAVCAVCVLLVVKPDVNICTSYVAVRSCAFIHSTYIYVGMYAENSTFNILCLPLTVSEYAYLSVHTHVQYTYVQVSICTRSICTRSICTSIQYLSVPDLSVPVSNIYLYQMLTSDTYV